MYNKGWERMGAVMSNIVVIAKVPHHIEAMKKVVSELNVDIPLLYAPDSEHCYELATREISAGAKIIICSDYLYANYFETLDAKIIPIYRSPFLFAKRIIEVMAENPEVKIITRSDARSFTSSIQAAVSLLENKPEILYADNLLKLRQILERLRGDGRFYPIIAPVWAHPMLEEYGFPAIALPFAPEDFRHSLDRAMGELALMEEKEKYSELFSTVLDFVKVGVVCFDRDGYVTGINRLAMDTLMIREDITGHSCEAAGLGPLYESAKSIPEDDTAEMIMTLSGVSVKVTIIPQYAAEGVNAYVATLSSVEDILSDERKIRRGLKSNENTARLRYTDIIGKSQAITQAKHLAKRYASADSTILIKGPTGCGKEVFAQSIHNLSSRRDQPFVAINCGALPESLLESILFGYDKGSFTGAQREGKRGLFEAAHKGTIFLDEISEMPLAMQARFLRVIQEREVMRIGSTKPMPVDVRIIAATNRDLRAMVDEKSFRADLYYRISVLVLELPPLSSRREDIPHLARSFLEIRGEELGCPNIQITPEALSHISELPLDGNVRELNNILERCIILSNRRVIDLETVMISLEQTQYRAQKETETANTVSEREQLIIMLEKHGGNRQATADALHISTATLWRKMKKYGLL